METAGAEEEASVALIPVARTIALAATRMPSHLLGKQLRRSKAAKCPVVERPIRGQSSRRATSLYPLASRANCRC
jgi:hypothetical protein